MNSCPLHEDFIRAAQLGQPVPGLEIVDCHGHLGPWYTIHIPRPKAEDLVETMDLAGVRKLAVSANAAIGPDFRRGNDQVADALRRFSDRFLGYAVVNPNYPGEVKPELERCFGGLGFHAIKLHTGLHQYPLNGPHYRPALELAQHRALVVLTHGCDGIAELAREFARANFIIAHVGAGYDGRNRDALIDLAAEAPNVYLDTASSDVPFANIEHLAEAIGPHKIVFGSDHPWIDVRYALGRMLFAEIEPADKVAILGGTFSRLLASA
jgi:predicted TIM-barrel fold metal-dependent hydrolase